MKRQIFLRMLLTLGILVWVAMPLTTQAMELYCDLYPGFGNIALESLGTPEPVTRGWGTSLYVTNITGVGTPLNSVVACPSSAGQLNFISGPLYGSDESHWFFGAGGTPFAGISIRNNYWVYILKDGSFETARSTPTSSGGIIRSATSGSALSARFGPT